MFGLAPIGSILFFTKDLAEERKIVELEHNFVTMIAESLE